MLEKININLSPQRRLLQYLNNVKDPYHPVIDGKKVKIAFKGGQPIQQILRKHFLEKYKNNP